MWFLSLEVWGTVVTEQEKINTDHDICLWIISTQMAMVSSLLVASLEIKFLHSSWYLLKSFLGNLGQIYIEYMYKNKYFLLL